MRLIDRPSLPPVVAFLANALAVLTGLLLVASPLRAQTVDLGEDAKYAAIVVDAASGEVLYARRADSPRYPASITKVMTLYMAFEALAQGTLSPNDIVTVSANAQAQSPMKLGLGTGATLTVDEAMKAIAVYSANDIAVALAEKIGGTEQRFSALMTLKAQELGMSQTRFVNASGLPNSRQLSSARDLAILARAVMRDYPQYYEYFNVRHWAFRGRTYVNHNPLLAIPGVDGMKTGFTNASGYNLAASMVRNENRLIVVMLGGRNKEQRREHVAALLNTGFDVINRRQRGEQIAVAQTRIEQAVLRRTPVDSSAPTTTLAMNSAPVPYTILAARSPSPQTSLRGASDPSDNAAVRLKATAEAPALAQALSGTQPLAQSPKAEAKPTLKPALSTTDKVSPRKKNPDAVWLVQVGAFKQETLAKDWLKDIGKRFRSQLAEAEAKITKGDGWYRARYVGLTQAEAKETCQAMSARRLDCVVLKS